MTANVFDFDESTGPFTVTPVGGRAPEAPNGYLYQDRSFRFVFYSQPIILEHKEFEVHVVDAETDRFHNDTPLIPNADRRQVEENIRLFFMTRLMVAPYRLLLPPEQPKQVVFSWRLRP